MVLLIIEKKYIWRNFLANCSFVRGKVWRGSGRRDFMQEKVPFSIPPFYLLSCIPIVGLIIERQGPLRSTYPISTEDPHEGIISNQPIRKNPYVRSNLLFLCPYNKNASPLEQKKRKKNIIRKRLAPSKP